MPRMELKGAAVFVSGGGSGLGAATARLLAEGGARVAVFDRSREGAEDLVHDAFVATFSRVRPFPNATAAEGYVRRAIVYRLAQSHPALQYPCFELPAA